MEKFDYPEKFQVKYSSYNNLPDISSSQPKHAELPCNKSPGQWSCIQPLFYFCSYSVVCFFLYPYSQQMETVQLHCLTCYPNRITFLHRLFSPIQPSEFEYFFDIKQRFFLNCSFESDRFTDPFQNRSFQTQIKDHPGCFSIFITCQHPVYRSLVGYFFRQFH